MNSKNIDYLNMYENVKDELKFLTSSKIRIKLLECLSEIPVPMKILCENTNLNYSAISNNIHRLKDNGYVDSDDGKFCLNNIAIMKLLNFYDFSETVKIIRTYIDLWIDHDISGILLDGLIDLNSLKTGYLIESIPTDIYRPHNIFKNILKASNNIKSIFPFVHPEYPIIFQNLIENGANIEVLCGKTITLNFIESMDLKTLKNGSKNQNFKIKSSKNDIKIFLTVADEFMAFGLFKEDGTYDQNRLLISNDLDAVKWANGLFDYYNSIGNSLYI